jgi:hypothetical protein
VLEDCDISDWGYKEPSTGFGQNFNSAIYSNSSSLKTIIVQRCKLHHPRTDANSWLEPVAWTHPEGPQAITFANSKGNLVIRYNEIYSDEAHYFNDAMGEWKNFSYGGFPNRDSDIYGNRISRCWDDGIEAEGACMNIRVWGNYIDSAFNIFGLASTSKGPNYVWQNISNFSQNGPKGSDVNRFYRGGALFKVSASDINKQYANGKLYLFHNTSLQPPTWTPEQKGLESGVQGGVFVTEATNYVRNITSRNNIVHVRSHPEYTSFYDPDYDPSNDFDYDMYNGSIIAYTGSELHGVKLSVTSSPEYASNNSEGEFALEPNSKGSDVALRLPNFNDSFSGDGPDKGAFEYGFPPMTFGVNADYTERLHEIFGDPPMQFNLRTSIIGNGRITPAMGTFIDGAEVILTAVSDNEYEFVGWGGDTMDIENPIKVTMYSDMDITATFKSSTSSAIDADMESSTMIIYPNPFSDKLTISYYLFENTFTQLSIYNILGEKLAVLVNEEQSFGLHNANWNFSGSKEISNGIYICKLQTSTKVYFAKVIFSGK